MKLTVHRFKASGKWYDTFTITTNELDPKLDSYTEAISSALLEQHSLATIHPVDRTLNSWFVIVVVNDLPLVLWLL